MKLKQIGLVLICLLFLVAMFWRPKGSRFFSSPDAVRSSKAYEEIFSPAATPVPITWSWSDLQINTGSNYVEILWPSSPQQQQYRYPAEMIRAADGRTVETGDWRVALDSVAVGFGTYWGNEDYSMRLPARFYGPDLRPLPEEQVKQKFRSEWDRSIDWEGKFPSVKFTFSTTGAKRKLLAAQFFDARTHRNLASGYGSSAGSDTAWVATDLSMWHQGPVLVVLDMAFEPVTVSEVEAKPGTRIPFNGGELLLAELLNGAHRSTSSSEQGGRQKFRLTLEARPADKPETSLVFVGMPTVSGMPVDLEVLDQEGKTMDNRGSTSSGTCLAVTVQGSVDRVRKVRVHSYGTIRRLVFSIPEIPGLPEENRGLKNLFDVQIPFVRIREPHEFQNTLSSLLQMEVVTTGPNPVIPPNGLIFTNATAERLFLDYQNRLAKPHAKIDPIKHTVLFGDPPLMDWWNRVKRWFRP